MIHPVQQGFGRYFDVSVRRGLTPHMITSDPHPVIVTGKGRNGSEDTLFQMAPE